MFSYLGTFRYLGFSVFCENGKNRLQLKFDGLNFNVPKFGDIPEQMVDRVGQEARVSREDEDGKTIYHFDFTPDDRGKTGFFFDAPSDSFYRSR